MTNKQQRAAATGIRDILWMVVNYEVIERLYKLIDEADLNAAMRDVDVEYDMKRHQFEIGGSQ